MFERMISIAIVLVATAACHPSIERPMVMPTTEFCAPHHYNLPSEHEGTVHDPYLWVSAAGLEIDKVLVLPRGSDWTDQLGGSAKRYDLADGHWLILIEAKASPSDPQLEGSHPQLAYVWDPSTTTATFIGRGYAARDAGPFFLWIRGSQLMFADVDPDAATPALRALGPFAEQRIVGLSAGTAVLWTRDHATVTVSCLGGPARHFTVPVELDPVTDDAVRDQRVLLQTRSSVHGHDIRAELWILDLDRDHLRFIGNAVGSFEDGYTAIPSVRAVTRAAWTNERSFIPHGPYWGLFVVNHVDPVTETSRLSR